VKPKGEVMSDIEARRVYKLVENDELFWDNLRDLSESLGWELGQTLKACFVLGWDLLSQRMFCKQVNINDDKKELE